MGRRKLENKNTRKLARKSGDDSSSYYVTIPIDIVRQLNWQEGQKLVVEKEEGKSVIKVKDWKEQKNSK